MGEKNTPFNRIFSRNHTKNSIKEDTFSGHPVHQKIKIYIFLYPSRL